MWQHGDISLAYLTVDGATPEEHLLAAAGAGFDAAGFRIRPPTHLDDAASLVHDPAGAARLADACRQHGVKPLDAEVMSLTAATGRDDMLAMAEAAATLGFRFVQTVIEDEDLDRATTTLATLAEVAATHGLGVALEFMAFRPLSTLDAALSMVRAVNADNVGLLIDALHLDRAGGSVGDVAAIPPALIALVQLCDAPALRPDDIIAEARSGRLHPGDGALPLGALLDVLPDGLPLSLEVPHPDFAGRSFAERASRSMEALRRFLDERNAAASC